MSARVENSNPQVLRQCREQIGLNVDEVKKKVPAIIAIEREGKNPTFRQLDTLAKLYKVPRWVFISESLPEQYQFNKTVPAFREFATASGEMFGNYKIRGLTTKVAQLRNLIVELREDMGEPVTPFYPPALPKSISPDDAARQTREWLNIQEIFNFSQWRETLEKENIFIFMTSKYKGWSHVDKDAFRGLAIYHSTLPIIIVNDSDAKKAQSFTLFHELGHLLLRENAIDDWVDHHQIQTERWCDQFAGSVLMPAESIQGVARDTGSLESVEEIAKQFKVSAYACLVRIRQLEIIHQRTYDKFAAELKIKYVERQKKLQKNAGGHPRNRPTEVLNQYGRIYVNVLFQAYHNRAIGLHKLCTLFDLKRASDALQLEVNL